MGDSVSDPSVSLCNLLCREGDDCFDEEEDENIRLESNPCFVSEDGDDEYVETLVQKETSVGFGSKNCSVADGGFCSAWLKCARLDSVDWILNTRAIFGFRFRTAYLSVTYFDRFLSKRSIDDGKSWAVRLLSVACLSLAAKMEERKVPALSEFPVEGFDFKDKVILRMELLVLTTLDWKLGSITPFAYLHYFINKFCAQDQSSTANQVTSRAIELMVDMAKEVNLMDHRPSVIAAAAVLAASDDQLTRTKVDLKMSTVSSCGSLENEHIFSCYNLMQEMGTGKVKTPKLEISTSISSSSADPQKKPPSMFYSAVGTRRRLTFSDTDQNCPVKKIHRL